jgi:translation elongation factor EF-Ts
MTAGKRYSAGAIFLQVVPTFANVQNAIEAHAKDIDRALGDQMEKSGEKAGERAGRAAALGLER